MKLVIQNMARVWGGNEKSLVTLGEGLMMRGHEVIVSCPVGPVRDRAAARGLAITSFRPRGSLDPVSGASFGVWLAAQRPDALLITSWHSISWASFGARAARVPRVVLRQGIVRRAPSRGVRAHALRHWVDEVITNAPEIRDVWLDSLPSFSPDRVHVVLNAVAPLSVDRKILRERLRAEIGASDGTLLIGAAGIVTRRKNFELLLDAFAAAKPSDTRIVIIGDGPHRPELERLARELNIDASVHFVGHRDSAAEAIAGLDAFVLSSRNEGMANVMLEAMASGVPVIASDISGVRTAIGQSNERPPAGWIFPPDDTGRLAEVIAEVTVATRAGGESISARTREASWRIENWFSLERMLDRSERILFR
jgi:glycosyltransferase involved in cell wall biosynthesis